MPIRLNLLAEAHALEDLRRKDPVKRTAYIGVLLTVLVLAWASVIQFKIIIVKNELSAVTAQMKQCTNDFTHVVDMQKQIGDMNSKLAALHTLTTNRFLNGNLMDALQHATVEDVQLTRLRINQSYQFTAETKPRKDGDKTFPGKPATVTERTLLALDGTDSSSNPGEQVLRLKDVIAQSPYFKTSLDRANGIAWKNSSSPQISPDTGRSVVTFSLECRYPEVTR
ncbi:MAG: hypothetical protein M9920_06845 [Verrucomicrobiae bacterium]|nr:hypothetical protein [Verrucomicrobiae bacterium]